MKRSMAKRPVQEEAVHPDYAISGSASSLLSRLWSDCLHGTAILSTQSTVAAK